MSERWQAIREVLLRVRGGEPLDDLLEDAVEECDCRGWIVLNYPGDGAVILTADGRGAAGYMSDAEAFAQAFDTWRTDGGVARKRALPEDVPWPVLRDRLANERGWL